jgi:uncharacterized membrane protein
MLPHAIAVLVALTNRVHAQIPCGYEVTHVIQGPPCQLSGPPPTVGTSISPNGRYVCGYYQSCGFTSSLAWVYDTTTQEFTTLPLPAGFFTALAEDVNDAGLVVGHYGGNPGDFGFIYDVKTGQYTNLPPQNAGGTCTAMAINSTGLVCGYRSVDDGGDPVFPWNAFTWSLGAGISDLGVMNGPTSIANDIADDGTVVGYTGGGIISNNTRAFISTGGKLSILAAVPGGLSSAALNTNNKNEVTIWGRIQGPPNSIVRAFLWTSGEMVDLGILPGLLQSIALGINDNSTIVGTCSDPIEPVPFIWHDGLLKNINDLVDPKSGLYISSPECINNPGLITGEGINLQSDIVAFVLSPRAPTTGDTNCDALVDVDDLLSVINSWGDCVGCSADLIADGAVNLADLGVVLDNWSP